MRSMLYATAIMVLVSCGESGGDTNSSKDASNLNSQTETTNQKESDNVVSSKMKANPETIDGMTIMTAIINGFWEVDADERNYAYLAEELSYQTDYIIKNCTMKGADHEELHKILEPIIQNIELIKNAPSYEEANESIKNIEKLISTFQNSFELEEKPAS